MGRLFDYSKPGKGVSKNSSDSKRPFVVFWETFFRRFWDLLMAGLWYLLVSIPVVTRGLACCGLTYITRNYVRKKPVMFLSDFFGAIKKNWKQALPVGIVNLVVTAIMIYSLVFYFLAVNTSRWYILACAAVFCFLVIFFMMTCYIYLMMVTFKYKFFQLYKNAFYLAFLGLKSNLIIIATLFAVYGLFISVALTFIFSGVEVFGILIAVLGILLLPAFRFLLTQFYVFPVVKKILIDPYYKNNPKEFEAVRHYLNLENEETKAKDAAEAVFHDVENEGKAEPAEETPSKKIPKQYSEHELRGRGRFSDDEDDTI